MAHPVRACPICTHTDDHPRHVVTGGPVGPDGMESDLAYHMDCHAAIAHCAVCAAQIADAPGATGDALRAHLLTTGPGPDRPGWTAPTGGEEG